MCGICGFVDRVGTPETAIVGAMAGSLSHRGPDGQGVFVERPVALGHRRLSIIDLSDAASEPMQNEDGSLWLTFNGEIYNFQELRSRLVGRHPFRSQTDAEVILHLYEERGDEAVSLLDGMFAFALWDRRRNRLLLGRDRAGKKPLFYHHGPQVFAFASEVKALLAHGAIPRDRDPAALPLYLTYGYVPTPATFYKHIRAVPPGHTLALSEGGLEGPTPYWRVAFRNGSVPDDREAEERLRGLLRSAVARRLVADVPLGAFLSGGLDSSTVVAFMAEAAPSRVRTFSIGFGEHKEYDETSYARLVARHFGTEHTEFIVEPRALDLIDRLVWHHDGPFGDSSAVPTYLLSELTRTKVTVALSGDGGDEVFAGYLRLYGAKVSESLPRWLVWTLGAALRTLPEPKDRKHVLRIAKRFAEVASLPLEERYLRWNAYFPSDLASYVRPELLAYCDRDQILATFRESLEGEGSVLSRVLNLNFRSYLCDDLLVKMDRSSMAHGLEARSPFLDTEVIEFGASLPDRLRMRFGVGKILLRRAMRGILPPPILKRGKMGFGAPLGAWFRRDLGTFVRDRLLSRESPLYEYLRPEPIDALVARHLEERADLSPQIWALLTLESWLRQEGHWPARAA
jgi:asparagine synthase (glutamine-hydrolysing)